MGIIVFIGFCLIVLIVVSAIIGSGGFSKSYRYGANRVYFYEDDEDDYDFDAEGRYDSGIGADDSSDGEFYGGIPFGDGKIFLTDDDDFIDEFGDEF